MARIDCWRLLGVSADADADAVRAAFTRRARDVHPDGGGTGDSLTMRLLVEARDEALLLVAGRSRTSSARGERPRPRPQASAGVPPLRCYSCGREVPRERQTKRSRWGGLRLRLKGKKAPICAACAKQRRAYDPEQRNRRLLLATLVVSTVATIVLVIYMLRML